jgi:hypothetical protein
VASRSSRDAADVAAVPEPQPRRQRPLRVGKTRDAAGGQRGWKAKLYAPTAACPAHRIKFKAAETGQWVTRQVPAGVDPDAHFDKLELQLSQRVVVGTRLEAQRRDMRALHARYMQWLGTKEENYQTKVNNLVDVWVLRSDGDLLVEDWGPEDSQRWIEAARTARLSPGRVEDLGVALSGLRNTAHRKTKGGAWLSREDDPLEGVSYSRSGTLEGADRNFVPVSMRPTTAEAESLIKAARDGCRWPWMQTQVTTGVFCGPRLGEQLALRDIDVDLEQRELVVNFAVRFPMPSRGVPWALKFPKTGRRRRVPYPGRLHEPLRAACAVSLGLPADAPLSAVAAAQRLKLERKFAALDDATPKRGRPIEPDEGLLFVDSKTGLPPTKEIYGEEWRRIRSRSTWPARIPWRNARHHAATWWKRVVVDPSTGREVGWEKIASWLGNSVKTCLGHYVLAGSDDDDVYRDVLGKL